MSDSRCPTCESDSGGMRVFIGGAMKFPCRDPWHDSAPAAAGDRRVEPSPGREPVSGLREEVDLDMSVADEGCRHPEMRGMCQDCAVSVAVELVGRERKRTEAQAAYALVEMRRKNEAEAALAERGHVRACFCHDADCEGLYCTGNDRACLHRIMVSDPRCTPKGGTER